MSDHLFDHANLDCLKNKCWFLATNKNSIEIDFESKIFNKNIRILFFSLYQLVSVLFSVLDIGLLPACAPFVLMRTCFNVISLLTECI